MSGDVKTIIILVNLVCITDNEETTYNFHTISGVCNVSIFILGLNKDTTVVNIDTITKFCTILVLSLKILATVILFFRTKFGKNNTLL